MPPQTGSRTEIIPTVPHIKYAPVLHTLVRLLRQVQLQDLLLTKVDRAPAAFVGVVALYLHVAELVELGRVGENLIDSSLKSRCLENPVNKHSVGVRDDYAVDGSFMLWDERQQVRHSSCEGNGLHHTADPVGADLLLSWTDRQKKDQRNEHVGSSQLWYKYFEQLYGCLWTE